MGLSNQSKSHTEAIGCTQGKKDPMGQCGVPQAEVYFRPAPGYRGEFGFDWMRSGDWDFKNTLHPKSDFSENDYKKTIGGAYGVRVPEGSSKEAEAYKKLEQEYRFQPIHGRNENYHYHWLTLFPEAAANKINGSIHHPPGCEVCSEATLSIVIRLNNLADKPDYIQFISKDPKKISLRTDTPADPALPDTLSCAKVSSIDKTIIGTLTVNCLKDLNKNTIIEAYAIKGDKPPTLAGVLMLVKNNSTVRQKQNVALIYMLTNITGFDNKDGRYVIKENSIPPLYYFLHQNLLYGLVETTIIDVTDDIRFKLPSVNTSIRNHGEFVGTIPKDNGKREMVMTNGVAKVGGIFAYLKTHKLPRAYHNHIKNYIFEEIWAEPGRSAAGFSPIFGKETILFAGAESNSRACAHESGHSMGLPHTFLDEEQEDQNRVYYFKEQSKTDNIMSYNFQVNYYSTWYWQWKIVNNWIEE